MIFEKIKERIRDKEARKVAEELSKQEIDRRKWCVEQLRYEDDLTGDKLIQEAEKLYKYVYGEQK